MTNVLIWAIQQELTQQENDFIWNRIKEIIIATGKFDSKEWYVEITNPEPFLEQSGNIMQFTRIVKLIKRDD